MKISINGELRVKVRIGNWWPLSALTKTYRLPINESVQLENSYEWPLRLGGFVGVIRAAKIGSNVVRVVVDFAGQQVRRDVHFNDQVQINREITKGVFLDVIMKVE
jgi:hypothetical protein